MKNTWPSLCMVAAVVLTGCRAVHHRVDGGPATTTTAATTTTTTLPAPTTTVYRPAAPQSSADTAASHLVAAWRTGDRAGALTAATPAAVTAVFAQPYPAAGVQARGCSDALAGASTCDYRVSNGLLTVSAAAIAGGWIIESATFS